VKLLALALALTLTLGSPVLAAAPALTSGDLPATVTVGGRPLSSDTDHVVAFTRGKTLYVCVEDLKQMVSGGMTRVGDEFTVASFKGDADSKKYVFTIGSTKATAAGKPIVLSAPVVEAYGEIYVPLSFFGSPGVRTHVKIAADDRSGDIILPPDAM
jgi:hypothetical protein